MGQAEIAFSTDKAPASNLVKEIRISDLKYTKPETIARELISRVGEPYNKQNIKKDIERLDRLGIFSAIDIQPIDETDGVILEIEVREMFPWLPTVSIEVTDENGVSAGPGFRSINLFGRAVQFNASARFGGATNLEANIKDPNFGGDHLSYDVGFFQRDRVNKLDDFNEVSTEIGVRLGRYLGRQGRIGGLFGFLSLGGDVEGVTSSPNNRDNLPKLGGFVGYDSRDLPTNPHAGWWSEADVAKTGGDGDYWTFNLDLRRYQPIIPRHTLALFSLTTLQSGQVGQEIPEYMDFHIGGTNTVRGWHFDSQHGKNQFLNTIEYRYTLLEPGPLAVKGLNLKLGVQLAAFGDLGVAWNHGNELKFDNFIDGYGFGIRLLVPFVNVIRMDFGFGEPGQGMNFHFALWEKPVMQRARVR